MTTVDLRKHDGSVVRSIDLDDATFGVQPNVPLMHQVVTAQLAAARSGTQSTKTRAEVSGGGAKPYRQKGTGRARQGSTRAPHWSGGGVALGPKPRSYKQRTPKKMIAASLRSALSDRAADGHIAVVEHWNFDAPRTKDAKALLAALGLEGRVLLVLGREDENAYRSFRNLTEVQLLLADELNTYDVLCSDWIVFSEQTLPGGGATSSASAASTSTASAAPVVEPESAPEPTASVDVADEAAVDTDEDTVAAEDTATETETETEAADETEEAGE